MSGNGAGFVHGYVLAGGQSTRMGRDKAMLELDGVPLLRRVYELLLAICGSATIVGPRERYISLGLPLIEDARPHCGPLAGIDAALADCTAEWAIVVACDMPGLEDAVLRGLLAEAKRAGEAQVVLPVSPGGQAEPLCALYRPSFLQEVRKQLETGRFKLLEAIARAPRREVILDRPHHFMNVNRPEDWEALRARN
jgi:molybdopterin-guanine dinucleotide biosynthesis protein A